ncbi:MAG TPA: hypothetical protein VHG72_13960 [Polyangia bacterium]|nr:hypothetical protein [Polyangia bacterium]
MTGHAISWGKRMYQLYRLGSASKEVRRIVWRALRQTRSAGDGP